MLTAAPTSIHRALIARYFRRRARRRFAGVAVRGLDRLTPWSSGGTADRPLVIVANHSSWWDAVMPILLSLDLLDHDAYGFMERRQLERYRFFRRAGMISLDRDDSRDAMRSLDYAAGLLRDTRRVLWMFPQGRIVPNDARPILCESGAARLIGRIGRCAVAPIAFRYELLDDELPTAWAGVGEPVMVDGLDSRTPRGMTSWIAEVLTGEVDRLREAVLGRETDDFETILRGRGSIDARWDRIRGLTRDRD